MAKAKKRSWKRNRAKQILNMRLNSLELRKVWNFSPAMKAQKGLQLNFENILNQSITEELDITLNFPGSPMASPMNSPMASRLASPVHAKS